MMTYASDAARGGPRPAAGSQNGQELAQDARGALRDLVDEPGEVETGVLAGEVRERADL